MEFPGKDGLQRIAELFHIAMDILLENTDYCCEEMSEYEADEPDC